MCGFEKYRVLKNEDCKARETVQILTLVQSMTP